MKVVSGGKCEYCDGQGYVHLLLGGSESCYACQGSGKASNKAQEQNKNSKY